MKTVFVIEQGSYSDYHVVGVFSSKENAELIVSLINGKESYNDNATIAEWPLDPVVNELRKGMFRFSVWMLKDGTVERLQVTALSSYNLAESIHEWEREKAPAYQGQNKPNLLQADVWAKDEKHAIKITNEHRIQMLALGQWRGKL